MERKRLGLDHLEDRGEQNVVMRDVAVRASEQQRHRRQL
jgi:hypothetical protein